MDGKTNDVPIALLQETKNPGMHKIEKKGFTWFFSGGDEKNTQHGVAIVVANSMLPHVQDIVNINERLMYIV